MRLIRGAISGPSRGGIDISSVKLRAILILLVLAVPVATAPASGTAATPRRHRHGRHHRHHARRHHARHHHVHRHRARHHRAKNHRASARSASSAAPVPPCANANTPATAASLSEMRIAVECLVNAARLAKGLPALEDNAKLTVAAQSWTDWMVANNQFTHGSDLGGRISAAGYDWQEVGENIATGLGTPRAVVKAWLASPEHCQNIMDPAYVSFGTGVRTTAVRGFSADPSTWTQDFGLTMSQSAPSTDQRPMHACPYVG
jgi:uncharacterized protein YkwD